VFNVHGGVPSGLSGGERRLRDVWVRRGAASREAGGRPGSGPGLGTGDEILPEMREDVEGGGAEVSLVRG
jgi:hypothetical protein